MNKLEDITNCHVCGGTSLIPKLRIPIEDLFTNEDVIRDVIECADCETLHYIEDGQINYEFTCRIDKMIGSKINK